VPEVRANGVSLYYEGTEAARRSWAFTAPAARLPSGAMRRELATRGHTIVYDRRGHFRSERPEPYATDVHYSAINRA
jgi:hypothetical protein